MLYNHNYVLKYPNGQSGFRKRSAGKAGETEREEGGQIKISESAALQDY